MKTILEKGYYLFKTKCENCGCVFTYERINIGIGVDCPDCGHYCVHKLENAVQEKESHE